MKNFIVLLFLFWSYASYSQSVKSTEINNKDIVKLIGSIQSLEVFQGRQLYVTIFTTSNGSGSANLPKSHESSNNLLICITHYDEYPVNKLYSIGPFLKPKLLRKVDSGDSVTFFIEDVYKRDGKIYKVVLTETSIQIQ